MSITETKVGLDGYTQQDIAAIHLEAKRRGVSFDEAAKLMVLDHIKTLKKRRFRRAIVQLFRFPTVH